MSKLYIILICLISCKASAQVLSTTTDNGITIKYVIIQTGDTIITGVPFRPMDKIGMTLAFYKNKERDSVSISLRSRDPKINPDAIDLKKASLLITLGNRQLVIIKPIIKIEGRYGADAEKSGVYLLMSTIMSDNDLNILKNQEVFSIEFCTDDHNCVEIPINRKEKTKFKKAINYLMN